MYPSMPRSAIIRAGADHVVTAADLAELVRRLVGAERGDDDGGTEAEGASVDGESSEAS